MTCLKVTTKQSQFALENSQRSASSRLKSQAISPLRHQTHQLLLTGIENIKVISGFSLYILQILASFFA